MLKKQTVILGLPVSLDDKNKITIISPGCKSITPARKPTELFGDFVYVQNMNKNITV